MASVIRTVIYPVKDLDQAKALYGALLGVAPYAEAPYYVGFRVGDQELGLDPNGHQKGMSAPVAYVEVDDIRRRLDELVDAGGNVTGLAQTP
jgi:predicted enzyme related to lactoylglutathione lyase